MKIIITDRSSCVVISAIKTGGLVPRVGDYVKADDKDGAVRGTVSAVQWEFLSMNGPVIRVFLTRTDIPISPLCDEEKEPVPD